MAAHGAEYVPSLYVFDSPEDLGKACARQIVDLIVENQKENKPTVLGLATGSTPIPVYRALKQLVQKEEIDLSHLITFNLDEYLGLPIDDPNSYHSFMFEHLFSDLLKTADNQNGIDPQNIHIPNGYAKQESDLSIDELNALASAFPHRKEILSHEEEIWILKQRAKDYEHEICRLGPIDLQILGIGTNGHIGFAEPGFSFSQDTSLVQLTENTRRDNACVFNGEVPRFAITMGIGTILKAKKIYLLATGEKKREIVAKTLQFPISPSIPATSLRMHPCVSFFLDEAVCPRIP